MTHVDRSRRHFRQLRIAMRSLVLIVAAFIISQNLARADGGCCKPAGCCAPCECAPLVCRPVWETVPVTKTCFDVECKEICIPKVALPWQQGCNHSRCGKVIAVKTLKKREYECGHKCVCVWHVEPVCCASDCKPQCSQPQLDAIPLPPPSAPHYDGPTPPPPAPGTGTAESQLLRLR